MTRILLATVLAAFSLAAQGDKSTKATPKAETKVVDPVCGMTVDPKTAEKAVYKGRAYYFCSRSEKESFTKSPGKYITKAPKK